MSATVSPVFQVRVISMYEPGIEKIMTLLPLTFMLNPGPAHEGRRNARVNCFGLGSVSFNIAESPSGKLVSMATCALVDFHVAIEGTYRFTHRRLPDS